MSSFRKQDDDWICSDPDCKNVNYARRTHCHRCKLERKDARKATPWEKKKLGTEIGKSAADKSRGLFSADDWQCSQCANVNWSRRQSCNMCNAPKFTDVEERTGIGGGYNERTNVEYKKKSHSSDEEYDEFGRRRKKETRSKDSPRQSKSGDRKKTPAEEDEDDDEDEDEEGDLSKYNLWDDSDKEEGDGAKKEEAKPSSSSKRKERSKSRSRSSSRSTRSRSRSPAHRGRKRRYSRSSSSSSSSSTSSSSSSGSSSSHRRRRRR